MDYSKQDMTEIEQLTKKFENEGIVSTPIIVGGLGHMSQRLEKLVAIPGVDAIIVSHKGEAILMDKEKPQNIVHKINYVLSLGHANVITLVKKDKEIPTTAECVCHFDDFSDAYSRFGLGYSRQRS